METCSSSKERLRESRPSVNIQDENQCGVAAGQIFGMKKTVFNSADFATIVASSYASAH